MATAANKNGLWKVLRLLIRYMRVTSTPNAKPAEMKIAGVGWMIDVARI
jgi:hypothetical protein